MLGLCRSNSCPEHLPVATNPPTHPSPSHTYQTSHTIANRILTPLFIRWVMIRDTRHNLYASPVSIILTVVRFWHGLPTAGANPPPPHTHTTTTTPYRYNTVTPHANSYLARRSKPQQINPPPLLIALSKMGADDTLTTEIGVGSVTWLAGVLAWLCARSGAQWWLGR